MLEVCIVDRDSKEGDFFVLDAGQYQKKAKIADGWLVGGATGSGMRPTGGSKLRLRIEEEAASAAMLPEE